MYVYVFRFVSMTGRTNKIISHANWGDDNDVSELMNSADYGSLPSDALVLDDQLDEPTNSTTHGKANQFPQQQADQQDNCKSFADYFNLGIDRRQLGDRQGAINAFNEALRLNPHNAHAYYYRGVARFEIEDYIGAVEDFNQAIRITPEYYNAYRQLEKIRQKLLEGCKSLLPTPNNAITYYQHEKPRLRLKDYQAAIKEFDQALKINPELAEAHYKRGKSLHQLKNKEAASEDFKTAARLFCVSNNVEQLAKWTPFELGESNREEAISYLIQYLSPQSSCNQKRLTASAIHKLAKNFKNSCDLAIPYLLNNLSENAPQVRQYTLKALSALNLSQSAISRITEIAEKDSKDYNRDLAKSILEKINFGSN